jgi:hypothetical protein
MTGITTGIQRKKHRDHNQNPAMKKKLENLAARGGKGNSNNWGSRTDGQQEIKEQSVCVFKLCK